MQPIALLLPVSSVSSVGQNAEPTMLAASDANDLVIMAAIRDRQSASAGRASEDLGFSTQDISE
jgi:hypothetical protein